MRKKPLLIAVLLVLVSIPLVVFALLSAFNCGFLNNKMCCVSDYRVCCFSFRNVGCVDFIQSNKDVLCPQYCFEAQNRFAGGLQEHLVKFLKYCTDGCEDYPCRVLLQNGTYAYLNCSKY